MIIVIISVMGSMSFNKNAGMTTKNIKARNAIIIKLYSLCKASIISLPQRTHQTTLHYHYSTLLDIRGEENHASMIIYLV